MSPQEIYQRYAPLIYRRARRLLGEEQAARDACHEVFLRFYRALPKFEPASTVTWLYKVTTNHCLNILRDEQRRRRLLAVHAAAAPEPRASSPVSILLRGFPPELQEIAVYYFVDEMSQEEIARVLGVSQRTVSNRLSAFRGLAKTAWAAGPVEES